MDDTPLNPAQIVLAYVHSALTTRASNPAVAEVLGVSRTNLQRDADRGSVDTAMKWVDAWNARGGEQIGLTYVDGRWWLVL